MSPGGLRREARADLASRGIEPTPARPPNPHCHVLHPNTLRDQGSSNWRLEIRSGAGRPDAGGWKSAAGPAPAAKSPRGPQTPLLQTPRALCSQPMLPPAVQPGPGLLGRGPPRPLCPHPCLGPTLTPPRVSDSGRWWQG